MNQALELTLSGTSSAVMIDLTSEFDALVQVMTLFVENGSNHRIVATRWLLPRYCHSHFNIE